MKKLALLVLLVFSFALASFASPLPTLTLDETFQSGATFVGTLTFNPGYVSLVGVSGWLSGGIWPTEYINWIWVPSGNFAGGFGPQYNGNFLMSGVQPSYQDFITITYDFSAAPSLVLASPGGLLSALGGNNVDYVDPLVSGHFSPEPGTLVMFGTGVIGLAGLIRRKLNV